MKKLAVKPRSTKPSSPLQMALLVGSIFPIGATFLDLFIQGLPLELDSIVAVQAAQPLHWIIDLVPVALMALIAMQKGEKPTPAPKINAQVEERAVERVAKLMRTLEELKAALADQKTIEKQLRENEEHYLKELETVQSELDMLKRTSTAASVSPSVMPAASAIQQSESAEEPFAFDKSAKPTQSAQLVQLAESAPPQGRQYYNENDDDTLSIDLAAPQEKNDASDTSADTQFSVSESGLLRGPGLSPDDAAPSPATVAPAAPSLAEPFDLSEALARVDGDHELLAEMAELFLEESPRFTSEIRTALEKNDTQTLTYAAHTLKGSVGNFAAPEAAEAARQLEQMGRKGELAGAGVILAQLEAALGRLQPALEGLNTLEAA
jgi:HPt (histidine-containing phosphotransfer) domain-containing protein